MLQQFKSMNELVDYLVTLEERLKKIEAENRILRDNPSNLPAIDSNAVGRSVLRSIPRTNLLSGSFLKRAFAVWGHFFVANLIIGFTFFVLYVCLFVVLFGSVIQNSR